MRAFLWFLGVTLLTLVVAACLAYPVYGLVAPLGHVAFHRVASRLAMLVFAGELWWLARHLALRRRQDFGFGLARRRFLREATLWGVIGMASAVPGAAFLLGTGIRVPDPQFVPGALDFVRIFLVGVASGVAVALLEETVFRGAMHTAIERESGPWLAALLTAPLFAILHFFAKVRIPAEEVHWGSGFDLLLRSFTPLTHPLAVADSFLAWLAVGLVLSLTRVLTGNIAVAIGLHAGWVVLLRMLQQSTIRGAAGPWDPWVGGFDGLVGYWILPWSVMLALALWLTRGRWVPAARAA
ncbi:MAG: CPBP family intramembrane glutamic endopeptidase [Steroidobacteraceae bacterium]